MSNSKEKDNKEKVPIKRLFSNVVFIISYAWKIDKPMIVLTYFAHIFCSVLYALYASLFLKFLIEMLQDKQMKLVPTLVYVLAGMFILALGDVVENAAECFAESRIIRLNGETQREFIMKAGNMDLVCYDNQDYYNDFVIAAAQMEEMMLNGVLSTAEVFGESLGIIALATLIFSINPIIAVFPVAGFIINMLTRFKITELEYNYEIESKKIMRKADYSKRVFYQPEYAKEIKMSEIRKPLEMQFDKAVEETMDKARKIGIKVALLSLVNWVCTFTVLSDFAIPVYLGYMALVKKSIRLSSVAAMSNSEEGVRDRLDGLNYAFVRFQRVGQFAERFRRFAGYEVKIEDAKGKVQMPDGKQTLEIKDVSFRYEGAKKDTLKHINMTIKPGEKIAFVGENGAGKSTFVKLLMRLYDVTDGSIEFAGHDIRDYGTKDYRNHIGAVFQDYQIYGATLGENVLMDEMKKEDEVRVKKSLEFAGFGEKLKKLPDGLYTNMTREFVEDGTMLSGGEAQKVAIARMFSKEGKLSLAILDEPSSALDPLAEYKLNKNMLRKVEDATVIFISHRLSTTRDADRIYLFENGEIIEQGTHDELMELNGHYSEMFEKQAHYYQKTVV